MTSELIGPKHVQAPFLEMIVILWGRWQSGRGSFTDYIPSTEYVVRVGIPTLFGLSSARRNIHVDSEGTGFLGWLSRPGG